MQVEQSKINRDTKYAGFGMRMLAAVIDVFSTIILIPIFSLFDKIYNIDAVKSELQNMINDSQAHPETLTVHDLLEVFAKLSPSIIFQIVIITIIVMIFWIRYLATPGKMLLKMRIVDARTGGAPTKRQLVIRYISCIFSALILGIGFIWIYYDKKHQGLHDKFAGTVVIYKQK